MSKKRDKLLEDLLDFLQAEILNKSTTKSQGARKIKRGLELFLERYNEKAFESKMEKLGKSMNQLKKFGGLFKGMFGGE